MNSTSHNIFLVFPMFWWALELEIMYKYYFKSKLKLGIAITNNELLLQLKDNFTKFPV